MTNTADSKTGAKKRTGLYFGSFNPVHNGHLAVANYLVANTDMKEIWLVVSPQNPFKKKASLAPDYDRLRMVELAVDPYPALRACDVEYHLPKPSYTSDTLICLSEKHPNREFCLIMGADIVAEFHRWKNYEFLLRYFPVYIYPRPGFDQKEALKFEGKEIILLDNVPTTNISASEIRRRIAEDRDTSDILPSSVIEYVRQNGLYGAW